MSGVTAQTCARPRKTAATNYAKKRKTQMGGGMDSQVNTACIRFRDPRLIVEYKQEPEPTLDQMISF
jgi:hypothetical protein